MDLLAGSVDNRNRRDAAPQTAADWLLPDQVGVKMTDFKSDMVSARVIPDRDAPESTTFTVTYDHAGTYTTPWPPEEGDSEVDGGHVRGVDVRAPRD